MSESTQPYPGVRRPAHGVAGRLRPHGGVHAERESAIPAVTSLSGRPVSSATSPGQISRRRAAGQAPLTDKQAVEEARARKRAASRLAQEAKTRKVANEDDEQPGIMPMIMLLGVAITGLIMPFAIFFSHGLPEVARLIDLQPATRAGNAHPTKSVTDFPRSGVHFEPGKLHTEGRALGDENAPRSFVEFTDFFCDHCKEGDTLTMQPLMAHEAVRDGRLRIESHPVAFLDDDSLRAAAAALCAQEQHKYWEVREVLLQVTHDDEYLHQGENETTVFDALLLKRVASLARLDARAFKACFASRRYETEAKRISQLARRMGIVAAPTYLVNGVQHEGPIKNSEDALTRIKLPVIRGVPVT